MRLECPECEAAFRISSLPEDGKRVKCPKCGMKFHPPAEEDEEEEYESRRPAKKGKKKAGGFPIVPVAIVSIGLLALGAALLYIFVIDDGNKKPANTASNNNAGGNDELKPTPFQLGTGGRPNEEPPEVTDL